MKKKVNIHIEGIYGWGIGWINPIQENASLFEVAVMKACNRMDLSMSVTDFGVIEGRNGETYVYFHPMTTAVEGCEDGAEEVARIIKEELDKSELNVNVSISVL